MENYEIVKITLGLQSNFKCEGYNRIIERIERRLGEKTLIFVLNQIARCYRLCCVKIYKNRML